MHIAGPRAARDQARRELVRLLLFDAMWVAPVLVGAVAFTEWTGDDRMRHLGRRRLRSDKNPHLVAVES